MIRLLIEGDDHEWQNHLINVAFEKYGSEVDILVAYGDPEWSVQFTGDTKNISFIIEELKNNCPTYHKLDKKLFIDSIQMYELVFNKFTACYKSDELVEKWKNEGSYIRM